MASINSTGTLFSQQHLWHEYPFYYVPRPSFFPGISDQALSLAAPVVAYWASSLLFHTFDISGWKWLDKYRIHDSAEVASRNLVTRTTVIWAVLFQQVIQTILGVFWMSAEDSSVNPAAEMEQLAGVMARSAQVVLSDRAAEQWLKAEGARLVYLTYWWFIPAAQLLWAMCVMDTWQYILHRSMHVNKFLYKHLHSVHHRLYVPYAFGALYNHPLEGFLLDSVGAVLSEVLSFMTVRQAAFFFVFSTCKTVDDHCGYSLPFDPLQWLSGNNADYHDIHHQVVGIKSNFSQPFFVHWDVLLGTRLTRKEIELRREKTQKAA
ncbi:hypothetical protein EW146_g1889 [Bondarzewia mesenterica]|uniref:Fatty acid hydroxylase domain-containing protein n=1 Tax=Bondarzewia mesenterica TaxID=1095465 RepID=A0A4S4M8M0_9AGAM|nr:hypothetical protein EW146_g1889 [Bondarzewia mesenterica]